ncbi:hypothetical protein NDU88_006708 [Pleurodeles waltl]|uniref:Uncharacterized protein n=1 Tax=Pleurodeles waltl TaxID=8319 RepID=A0AAV7NUU0_PLEWA|nr:hypothetical protein NDU88_006708 [Pleurodeles waltl]
MPAAGVSHFAPAPGERSLCRAFPVQGRLPFACSRSPDRAMWAGPQPRGQIQLARNSAGGGWETACGGQQAEARDIQARLKPHFRSGRVVIAAGSAWIKVRSSCSVRGPAGRAVEEGEQGAAPGCRGPERADPAPGPSPHTSIPGVRDLRPPWSPFSPASDFICREPLCRAPLLRRRSPAIGTARLQPRSATIRPLP